MPHTPAQRKEAAARRKREQRYRDQLGISIDQHKQMKEASRAEETSHMDSWVNDQPPTEPVKQNDILHLFESTEERLLRSIDWSDIKKAGLKDRALAIGIFHDKAQIMRGKPTQILRINDRSKFTNKFELLMKEAVRRGILEPGARPELPAGVVEAEFKEEKFLENEDLWFVDKDQDKNHVLVSYPDDDDPEFAFNLSSSDSD